MQHQDIHVVTNQQEKNKAVIGVFQGLLSSLLQAAVFQLKGELKDQLLSENAKKLNIFSEARVSKTGMSLSEEEIKNNNKNIYDGICTMTDGMLQEVIDKLNEFAIKSDHSGFWQTFFEKEGETKLRELANNVLQKEILIEDKSIIIAAADNFVNLVKDRKHDLFQCKREKLSQ